MANSEAPLQRPGWLARVGQAHARAFFFTLGTLSRSPIGTLLTALVIGVTLALPAGFQLAVRGVSTLSYSWETTPQASLFLKDSVSEARGRELSRDIGQRTGVAESRYLSREQSLAEFRAASDLGAALDALDGNPLPAVIVLTPARTLDASAVQALIGALGQLPEVEAAKFDQEWLTRFQALVDLVQRAVLVMAGLLALAVVVIVGNTIRLDLEGRREEIAIMKLIGAPDSFIRRPFLYAGLWYGLAGGLLALMLVAASGWMLEGPARRLLELYGSTYNGQGLTWDMVLMLLGAGLSLGLAGALLTVSRHLARIQPD